MTDFDGLAALITGGSSGIGAATAELLRDRGARVAIFAHDTSGAPSGVLALSGDVTDSSGVDRALSEAAAPLGRLDILINNAGIGATGTIADNSEEEWHRVLDVNVVGIARVSRAALPYLRRSAHAVIINVSSAVSFVGVRSRALYSASKGAVTALTLAMAADHVEEGIRVNAVAPGTTATPWVDRLLQQAEAPEAAAEKLRARQPIGRLVTAAEVAHAIASLATPAAAAITGAVLRVDGGMTTLRL